MTGARKTASLIWVKICLVIIILLFFTKPAMGLESPTQRVLILYETRTNFGSQYPLVEALSELLGHFKVDIQSLSRSEYTPGIFQGYDIVFYLGTNKTELSKSILKEFGSVPKLVWIDNNLSQYVDYNQWKGFKYRDKQYQYISLLYKEQSFPLDGSMSLDIVEPDSYGETLAWADNYSERSPYIWKRNTLWYVGALFFNTPNSAILADLLHDILGEDHTPENRVLVRIEDVDPVTNPKQLDELVDCMAAEKIPFAIAVVPAHISGKKTVNLNDSPLLVASLQRAEKMGGCIIQHGYSHQNQFSQGDGEGFEFWNYIADKPLAEDNTIVGESVDKGLEIFVRAGLFPVAFEPPHYAMSGSGYRQLAQRYSSISGRTQLTDESYAMTIALPYTVRTNRVGMTIIPENLGYYDPKDIYSINGILKTAQQLLVLRDVTTGVFYHNYFPPEKLKTIIVELKKLNYHFLDLRTTSYWVKSPAVNIECNQGHLTINTNPNMTLINTGNGYVTKISEFINRFSILIVIATLFLFVIAVSLSRNLNRLYEERGDKTHEQN